MTRRMASKMMPPHWNRKPVKMNCISPTEAIMTPTTMKDTFPSCARDGGETLKTQPVIRVTTGIVAFS